LLTVLLSALLIGLSLGLLGAGGSILTVPVLAYGVGFTEKEAIVGALFIVAAISASTVVLNIGKGKIHKNAVLWLSLTGIVGSFIAVQASHFVPGNVQFLLLACIMLAAAWQMLKSKQVRASALHISKLKLTLTGTGLGAVTGFVGVGGGFLIIPALVTVLKVPMKQAVSTSLAIIFFNAFAGFSSHLITNHNLVLNLDWIVVLVFSLIGILGSIFGQKLANKLPQQQLKQGFSVLIFLFALGIIIHSLYLALL